MASIAAMDEQSLVVAQHKHVLEQDVRTEDALVTQPPSLHADLTETVNVAFGLLQMGGMVVVVGTRHNSTDAFAASLPFSGDMKWFIVGDTRSSANSVCGLEEPNCGLPLAATSNVLGMLVTRVGRLHLFALGAYSRALWYVLAFIPDTLVPFLWRQFLQVGVLSVGSSIQNFGVFGFVGSSLTLYFAGLPALLQLSTTAFALTVGLSTTVLKKGMSGYLAYWKAAMDGYREIFEALGDEDPMRALGEIEYYKIMAAFDISLTFAQFLVWDPFSKALNVANAITENFQEMFAKYVTLPATLAADTGVIAAKETATIMGRVSENMRDTVNPSQTNFFSRTLDAMTGFIPSSRENDSDTVKAVKATVPAMRGSGFEAPTSAAPSALPTGTLLDNDVLQSVTPFPSNPLNRRVIDDVARMLVAYGYMSERQSLDWVVQLVSYNRMTASVLQMTWWNVLAGAFAVLGVAGTARALRWKKLFAKVLWVGAVMPGIRAARRLYDKNKDEEGAARMVTLEAYTGEVSCIALDPHRIIGLHSAVAYIRNSQLKQGLQMLISFGERLAKVPTPDHAFGIGVAYLRNTFAHVFGMVRTWTRPKLAVGAILGILALWSVAPVITSALGKEFIVEMLLWVSRGFFSTLSAVNVGHLQYLLWGMQGIADVMGVDVVKNMVGKLSGLVDASNRNMRNALYAIGTSAMYVVYGPPKNPALLKALEPKHALRMLPPSKEKGNFIAKIGKNAYDLVHPWTILKFIWNRGAWRMSFLLMLWRMTVSSSSVLSSLSTTGKVVSLFL